MLFAITIAVVLASATPPPVLASGTFRVLHDVVDVDRDLWDPGCGPVPTLPQAQRGELYTLVVDEDGRSFAVQGPGRAFGHDRCEGENASLAVTAVFRDGGRLVLKCRSTRVVRGTEETTHTLSRQPDGKLKIALRSERRARVRRNDCRVALDRHTLLAPVEERTVSATPGAKAAPKPDPTKVTAHDIEGELERQLARARDEAALGSIQITHAHQTSKDFTLLEARYVLDGKELQDNGRAWSMMEPGTTRVVLDDVAAVGVHVLELELVYRATVQGAPAKLRLKDAVFFDVDEKSGARVAIIGAEREGALVAVEDRPVLRFTVNGKPVAK